MANRSSHFLALVERAPDNELFRFSLAQALVAEGRAEAAGPHYAFCVAKKADWMMLGFSWGNFTSPPAGTPKHAHCLSPPSISPSPKPTKIPSASFGQYSRNWATDAGFRLRPDGRHNDRRPKAARRSGQCHHRLDDTVLRLQPAGEFGDHVGEIRPVRDPWTGVDGAVFDQGDDAREVAGERVA
jgi:hypothetical protein